MREGSTFADAVGRKLTGKRVRLAGISAESRVRGHRLLRAQGEAGQAKVASSTRGV
jgi:hypothetical protein